MNLYQKYHDSNNKNEDSFSELLKDLEEYNFELDPEEILKLLEALKKTTRLEDLSEDFKEKAFIYHTLETIIFKLLEKKEIETSKISIADIILLGKYEISPVYIINPDQNSSDLIIESKELKSCNYLTALVKKFKEIQKLSNSEKVIENTLSFKYKKPFSEIKKEDLKKKGNSLNDIQLMKQLLKILHIKSELMRYVTEILSEMFENLDKNKKDFLKELTQKVIEKK